MSARIVAFCLYGNSPMYHRGAVENARLMPAIYPGWKMRVYCENPTDTQELEALGVEVRRMGRSFGHSGMLWRFLPAWEPGVERAIFRDADSRLNVREAAAVADWIDSGFAAHAMLDHPHHNHYVMMGGTWGILGGVLPGWVLARFVEAYGSHALKGADCEALMRDVYPLIRGSLVVHSSVPVGAALDWPARPFPQHAPWRGFCGQQIDDDGNPMWATLKPCIRTGGELCQT